VKQVDLIIDAKVVNPPRRSSLDRALAEVPEEISSAANAIADVELREKFVRAATDALSRRQKES
jgi:hypothetical protein